MALIECPNCGKQVSDKADVCIHCNASLRETQNSLKECKECGELYDASSSVCPNCGCPEEHGRALPPESLAEIVPESEVYNDNLEEKKKGPGKTIAIVCGIVVLLIVIAVAVTRNPDGKNTDSDRESSKTENEISDEADDSISEDEETEEEEKESVETKASPDKYTWYVKNYEGKNLANVGYTALDGNRHDTYGAGNVTLAIITEDGSYVDPEDEEALKNYSVTAQDIPANTEMKLVFDTDEKGEEYDNLVTDQSYGEIALLVRNNKGAAVKDPVKSDLTEIKGSDRYHYFIRDYVGRNLLSCGYTALGGFRADAYGGAVVKFTLSADDGTYIDPEDEDLLKQYYVESQSVEPNSEMEVTYDKDENGKEYSNLTATQTYETIDLTLHKMGE